MSRRQIKWVYRRLRRPVEWFLIWLALALIPAHTLSGIARLARILADLGYFFDSRGKAIARANLKVMFGNRLTPRRERIIIRHSYRNMARVVLNVFWMSRDTRARMAEQVSFSPGILEPLKANLPAITVSAHLGNWEILSQACVANGIPMMSVAKTIGTPEMTARLSKLRSTLGQQIVPAEGALRPLMNALKSGTSIGLLIDQHTQPWDGGIWVRLFGLPVGISQAPSALSRKYKAPIVFAWSRPLKDGRYRIEPGQTFNPDPSVDDATRTQQVITAFERVIRRHPSLWCLNYRRWRHIMPDDDPARYPFYARALYAPPSRLDAPARKP